MTSLDSPCSLCQYWIPKCSFLSVCSLSSRVTSKPVSLEMRRKENGECHSGVKSKTTIAAFQSKKSPELQM
jgi:hypothetical protein